MSTTNVYYVTSPFQYLCAFEARVHLKSQHNILIIEEGDTEKGLKQLEDLVARDSWNKIFRIGTQNRTIESPKLIKAIKHYVAKEQLKIDHICYGEFTSWRANLLLKNLDHQAPLYFDDGTLSLVEFEHYLRPKKPFSRQRWFQDFLLRLQGVRPLKSEAISDQLIVFSIFNFDDSPFCYIKNQFDDLLARYDRHEVFDESAPVGFIGQGAVGDKYQKSIDDYLEEIQSALNCTATGSMIYFPHRSEKPTVKQKVQPLKALVTMNKPIRLK